MKKVVLGFLLVFGNATSSWVQTPLKTRVYQTKVTLGKNDCTGVTVEDRPTTMGTAAGRIELAHAGQSYKGTVKADSSFTTVAKVIDAGDTRYRITIAGRFRGPGFEADVTVAQQKPDGKAVCSYVVHWVAKP